MNANSRIRPQQQEDITGCDIPNLKRLLRALLTDFPTIKEVRIIEETGR